jgi:predicted AlkP superfamily phosphohydrolase/phosphomutase
MLYIGGFDVVCHAFWQYRFPEAYRLRPPAPGDVAALGHVIDRYLEYLDREIGRLIAAFQLPPNVLVISDHGHMVTNMSTIWRASHGPEGVFIAAGPDVARRPDWVRVTYLDATPTILGLAGVDVLDGMAGRDILRSGTTLDTPTQ